MRKKQSSASSAGNRLSLAGGLLGIALLTGCAETMASGSDAGCLTYGAQRNAMPRAEPIVGKWGEWVADTDDAMTGACR